jgi:hypothetical protein
VPPADDLLLLGGAREEATGLLIAEATPSEAADKAPAMTLIVEIQAATGSLNGDDECLLVVRDLTSGGERRRLVDDLAA